MKGLILMLSLFLATSLSAQERVKTYESLGEDNAKITVYEGEQIIEVGYIRKSGDKWINTGEWKQYDSEGNITLKVKYIKGKRVETTSYQDNQVIKVYRKEG